MFTEVKTNDVQLVYVVPMLLRRYKQKIKLSDVIRAEEGEGDLTWCQSRQSNQWHCEYTKLWNATHENETHMYCLLTSRSLWCEQTRVPWMRNQKLQRRDWLYVSRHQGIKSNTGITSQYATPYYYQHQLTDTERWRWIRGWPLDVSCVPQAGGGGGRVNFFWSVGILGTHALLAFWGCQGTNMKQLLQKFN